MEKKVRKSQKEKVKDKLLSEDKKDKRKRTRLEVFLEFFIFGLIMGIAEDLIAVRIVTGEPISWEVVGIVALVALPFAAIGELLVDRVRILPKRSKLGKRSLTKSH